MATTLVFRPNEGINQLNPDWDKWDKVAVVTLVTTEKSSDTPYRTIGSQSVIGRGLQAVKLAAGKLLRKNREVLGDLRLGQLDIDYSDIFDGITCHPLSGAAMGYVGESGFVLEEGSLQIQCRFSDEGGWHGRYTIGHLMFERVSRLKNLQDESGKIWQEIVHSNWGLAAGVRELFEVRPAGSSDTGGDPSSDLGSDPGGGSNRLGAAAEIFTDRLKASYAREFGDPGAAVGDLGIMMISLRHGANNLFRELPLRSWALHYLALASVDTFRGFVMLQDHDTNAPTAVDRAKLIRKLQEDSGPLPKWHAVEEIEDTFVSFWGPEVLDRKALSRSLDGRAYTPCRKVPATAA